MLDLKIITPQQMLFEGKVESVTLPGKAGSFTVLTGHAPIISSLMKGKIVCKGADGVREYDVRNGFVEVSANVVQVCIE